MMSDKYHCDQRRDTAQRIEAPSILDARDRGCALTGFIDVSGVSGSARTFDGLEKMGGLRWSNPLQSSISLL